MLSQCLRRAGFAVLGITCVIATAAMPAQTNPVRHIAAYGYYSDDDPDSWATIQAQGHRLVGVITTSVTVADTSGRLARTHNAKLIALIHARGSTVHARVANFVNDAWSREIAHAVLTDSGARARAMFEILQLLDLYKYDGIHLALGNVPPQDRRAFSAFVADLSTKVHARGRALSIAVPAKVSDQLNDEWSGAFDYSALAQASDWIVVMAYGEHWANSPPGPVASLPWVEAVLRFATQTVPARKLVLGIAFYGYAWSEGPGEQISMREALARAARSGAQVQWDELAQVPFFRTPRTTVYFESGRSVELRMIMATRFGVAGMAFWRLGYESPDVWDSLGMFLRSSVRSAAR